MFAHNLAWILVVFNCILLEECASKNGKSAENIIAGINTTLYEQENIFSKIMWVKSSFDKSQNVIEKTKHYLQLSEGIFMVMYHSAISCCIDLFLQWRRYTSIVLIDRYSGLDEVVLIDNMLKHHIVAEVLTVDQNTDIKRILDKSPLNTNFIIICNDRITRQIIFVAKSLGFFTSDSTWTLVGNHLPILDSSIVISLRTHITLAIPKGDNSIVNYGETVAHSITDHINIFDVFYNYKTSKVDMVKFAIWTPKKQLIFLEDFEPDAKIKKLDGRKIRTIVFEHPPYSYISLDANNAMELRGLSIEVMSMLMHHFKITYEIMKIDDNWGNYVNGSYTGASGYLNRREADLSLNMFTMTSQRLGGILYSGVIGKVDLSLAYNRPDAAIPPTNYVLPFDSSVWILIILSFVVIVLLTAIVMLLSPGWQAGEALTVQSHTKRFRLLTGTFFEQVLEDPPGVPARIVYATLLISTTLVFAIYTSVFTSFLAYRDLKLPIKNLRDVVQNDGYIPLSLKNLMQVETFKKARSGVYRELWHKMITKGEICIAENYTAAVARMYSGKYVFTADGASIIAAIDNNCSVELIRTEHMREYAYVVSRLDFPFYRIFYTGLTRLIEGGIMRKLWKIHMLDGRPPCSVPDPSSTFGLDQVSGIFFILVCGIILALICFALEKIVYIRSYPKVEVKLLHL